MLLAQGGTSAQQGPHILRRHYDPTIMAVLPLSVPDESAAIRACRKARHHVKQQDEADKDESRGPGLVGLARRGQSPIPARLQNRTCGRVGS